MLFLGIDLGTSFVKVSVVDGSSQKILCSVQYPETEEPIIAPHLGWAEQDPEKWWENTKVAIRKAHASRKYDPKQIAAIGIAYQMHGLVLVDKSQNVLRNAIIWCDSRAVAIGEQAFHDIGKEYNLTHHLNSPGNFTASKLSWIRKNEPDIYEKIDKIMLPGDYLAMRLTKEITCTISSLSEGVFWDFKNNCLSSVIINYFGFNTSLFSDIRPVFANHGQVDDTVALELSLSNRVVVSYKAGDQPNNALSLNVLEPGEVATTAGTSGVIYGISDRLFVDKQSRVNTFAHVNYAIDKIRTGVLLCINGAGIMYSWAKRNMGQDLSYTAMNSIASHAPIGSGGLRVFPFGNGNERMLNDQSIGAQIEHLDLNRHGRAHILKAIKEGVAFSFRYGLDIMRENGLHPQTIRAGNSNLFLSEVFQQDFVGATGVQLDMYENDGSVGAALGAAIGVGYYVEPKEAFTGLKKIKMILPDLDKRDNYEQVYQEWKTLLLQKIKKRD